MEWPFCVTSFEHFEFGAIFVNWIKTLDHSPTASVTTNGYISQPFALRLGSRQGYPLSPLLFPLFIELLASAIRQSNSITGIHTKSYHHKISSYDDILLLYITDPSTSVPSVHILFDNYGKVSGYSIIWSKSEILPLSNINWDAQIMRE